MVVQHNMQAANASRVLNITAEPFPEFIQNIIKKGGLIKSIM